MGLTAADIQEPRIVWVRERISAFIELTKPRIGSCSVLTSAAGFILFEGSFDFPLFANAMIGITLLAFGVATLNQYIGTAYRHLMTRTARRPLYGPRNSE